MISDAGVVVMPPCTPAAQRLLGCVAPELIFPLQAQLWGAREHCKPLLSPDLQSLSLPRWLIWLTQNKIWRRTDHALTCLGGIAEPSSEMAWLLWTRGSTFWRGLGRDAKTYHAAQLCSESFCGSSQEALRDRTKGSSWGATGLSVIQRSLRKRPPGCVLPARFMSNTRDWVWGRPSSLGTNNPFEEQPEKCDTAVEEMQQWMHATVPTLDTARATARRESEVTVLLSCSTGWIQDTGTA